MKNGRKPPKPKQILERKLKSATAPPATQEVKCDEEDRIRSWLRSITGKEFLADRTVLNGKELDMYNHSLRFAVEYCGLYWHTEDSPSPRDKWFHYNKFRRCRDYGIRLVTLYEDEWLNHGDKVKSMLKTMLELNERKLTMSQCRVVLLSMKAANEFLSVNHLQGASTHGQYACGLVAGDELVAVMVFAPLPRAGTFRVDRVSYKLEVSVRGGNAAMFSRLLILSNAYEVLGWSDNRWSNGVMYSSLGFERVQDLPPDYSYVHFVKKTRTHRKIAEHGINDDLGVAEMAKDRELHRIWDCGAVQWRWTKDRQTGIL